MSNNISAKVAKLDAPLLVVGLGGTGSKLAGQIKKAFKSRLEIEEGKDCPPRTRFVVFDTAGVNDEPANRIWSPAEFLHIDGNFNAIKARGFYEYEKTWFEGSFQEDTTGKLSGGNGAGAFRQIGRLYLFENYDKVRAMLKKAIQDVMTVQVGQVATKKLNIMVLCGLSGGTGSGTFLDTAYIIRDILANEPGVSMPLSNYKIESMLVMPDVFVAYAGNDIAKAKLNAANGYAALTELDFWMNYPMHKHVYTQKYSRNSNTITWGSRPYDDVTLLCATQRDGNKITEPLEHIKQVVAEYMVNAYSADFNGNASVSINGAGAQGGQSGPDKETFTFSAQQSNDMATLALFRETYPVPYAYRSIGAFSNTADQLAILSEQDKLIYSETIRVMDYDDITVNEGGVDQQIARMQRMPDMNGPLGSKVLAEYITNGVGVAHTSELFSKFHSRNPIQVATGEDYTDDTLKTQDYETAPHGRAFEATQRSLRENTSKEKIDLFQDAWTYVSKKLDEMVADYKRGPRFAYDVITDPSKGVLALIENEIKKAGNTKRTANNRIQELSGQNGTCQTEMIEFQRLNIVQRLLNGKTMFSSYVNDVDDMYRQLQEAVYCEALEGALELLYENVVKYVVLLNDMTIHIRKKESDLENVTSAGNTDNGRNRMLNSVKVNKKLIDAFNDKTQKVKLVKAMYKGIVKGINEAMNQNTDKLSYEMSMDILDEEIDTAKEACFATMLSMTLDDQISAFSDTAGADDQAKIDNYVNATLMPMLKSGADPMFETNENVGPEFNNAIEGYICTIPNAARMLSDAIQKQLAQTKNQANVRDGVIADRIFYVTSLYGMPMRMYTSLKSFSTTFYEIQDVHHGQFLCMNDNHKLSDSEQQDWRKLPTPLCERTRTMDSETEKVAKKLFDSRAYAAWLTENSVDNKVYVMEKMEEHDAATPRKVLRFKSTLGFIETGAVSEKHEITWLRLKPTDAYAKKITVEMMEKKLAAIEKDNKKPTERLAKAMKILENMDVITIDIDKLEHKAQGWSAVLGCDVDFGKAMNADIPADELLRLLTIRKECFERAVLEYVMRRPQLVDELKVNQECLKLLNEKMNEWNRPDPEMTTENCKNFIKMVRYGLIKINKAGAAFVNEAWERDSAKIFDMTNRDKADKMMTPFYPLFADEYDVFLCSMLYYAYDVAGSDNRDAIQKGELDKIQQQLADWMDNENEDKDIIAGYNANNEYILGKLDDEAKFTTGMVGKGKMFLKEKGIIDEVIGIARKEANSFKKIWG